MASLTAEQYNAVRQRSSLQDLADFFLILDRDGEISVEGGGQAIEGEDADAVAAAEEARDTAIANSLAQSEPVSAAPTDEELSANVEASVAAGESEEAAAPKSAKKEAAAQGA